MSTIIGYLEAMMIRNWKIGWTQLLLWSIIRLLPILAMPNATIQFSTTY